MPAIGFAAADLGLGAADVGAGALGVLDAGLVGGAVPGAIADVGALGAADALGAAGAADVGLGVADLGVGADLGSAFGGAAGGAAASDLSGVVGLDALGGVLGGDALGAGGLGLGPTVSADVASLTPGATSLGGTTAALGGATGAPVSATGALEAAADPSTIFDIAGAGDPTFEPAGGTTAFPGGGNVLANAGGGIPSLPQPSAGVLADTATASADIPGTFGQTPLLPGPAQTSGFVPTATGSPVGGSAVTGGDVGGGGAAVAPFQPPSLGLGPGSVDWNQGLGLTAKGGVPAVAGDAGGLFGTGISGKDAALYGLAGAPLAMALFKGEPGVPPQANQATALSPQEQAYAQGIISTGGAPNAYQSAQIAQNSQNRINQYRQILFNQGVTNPEADSRWPAFLAQDAQEQAKETVAFQQQNMADALAAAGGAQQGLLSVAQLQSQQDTAYTQALQNAMKSAGTTLALGGAFGNKVQPSVNIG